MSPAVPGQDLRVPLGEALRETAILIVEDEAVIAWQLESLFEDMGFVEIALASNGRDAIARAAATPPGLIVSDINLGGGVDGVEAVATIRASAAPRVPVLFVTGYASDEVRRRIDDEIAGASVLRKPVQTVDLRQAVIDALQPAGRD